MAFDVEGARKAGYSDAEINQYLGQQSKFDVEGARKAGYNDAEILQHLSAAPKKPTARVAGENEGDFMRGIANIPGQIENIYGAGKVLTGLVANKLGAKETGKDLIKSGVESMDAGEAKQVVKESDDFLKAWEKGIGTVVTDWLPYQVGAGAGNIAETLAFMGIGAAGASAPGAIAGALSKSLIKTGLKEAAEKIAKEEGKEAAEKFVANQAKSFLTSKGATAGMVGQAVFHGAGETTGRTVEETEKRGEKIEDINLNKLLPAAAAHAVADFVVEKIGINSMGVSKDVADRLITEMAKRIAITGTKEIPAEELQTIAERFGANLSLTDAEAMKEYVNTAATSYAMSVVPGGIGGARSHIAASIAPKDKTEDKTEDKTVSDVGTEKIAETTAPETVAEVDPELDAALKPAFGAGAEQITEEKTPAPVKEATALDEEIAKQEAELIALEDKKGHPSHIKAKVAKIERLKAQRDAEQAQGESDVTEPVNEPIGDGAELSAPPAADVTVGEPAGPESNGVVPAGTNVGSATVGKEQQPTAIEPAAPVVARDAEGRLSTQELIDAGLQATAKFDQSKVLTEEEEKAQADKFYEESLGNGPQRHDKITPEQKEEYEETRKALAEEGISIPEWSKGELNSAAKDVYFSHIVNNTIEENMNAGRKLAEYRKRMDQLEIPKEARRLVNSYENDRASQSKLQGIEFPEWTALPADIQAIYEKAMGKATSGIESRKGFEAIAELVRVAKLKNKTTEEQQRAAAKARAAEEQKQKEQERKELEASQPRPVFATNFVPNDVAKMVKAGDLLGVMQYLRSRAKSKVHQAVAQRIFEMKLNTKIKMVESLPKGHLAEYDPVTDTISVTAEGLTDKILLHEVTHAATVQVLNHYLAGRYKQLTAEQLDAAEHLEQLMEDTKPALGSKHREAYKNLYEFVSYAMTDGVFQSNLNRLQQNETHATTILPEKESMWSDFKLSIAKLIGITKELFKGKKLNVDTPVNYFMEVASAFEDILSVPEGKIEMKPLPSTKKADEEGLREVGLDTTDDGYGTKEKDKPKSISYFKRLFTTVPGWKLIATKFQNSRYPIKSWEDTLEMADKIFHEGKDKINNIYTQITFAAADAKNLYIQYVSDSAERLNQAVGNFARAAGLDTEKALVQLHKISEALHEPERRRVKYLLNVPLRDKKKSGERVSPAARRAEIIELLDTKKLTLAQAQQLRAELDFIVDNHTDPLGTSPRQEMDKKGKVIPYPTNMDAAEYNVTGLTQASVAKITQQYNDHPQHAEIKQALDAVQELHKSTTELNKMANYWSQPVDNRVNFYGFKQYIPLKGYTANTETDDMLAFDTMRGGKELQELDYGYEGRVSVSDNPVLQTMSDATRSAMRAGRRNLTLAIKNAIQQKLLYGKVHSTISFADRQRKDVLDKLPRENTVFHYNEDGSIDVLQISEENLREAIRRTYQQSKPIVDLANQVTSAIGTLHTRYNYAFAPMNFVRDALTNAFAIGADMGPAEAKNFVKAITGQVLQGGLYKAMKVAILYEKGDKQSQQALHQLGKNDPYIKNMIEFIDRGGMVSYLQGLALKSNFQQLHKEIGRSGIVRTKEQLDKFVDVWTDMFELASRAAAYGVAKQNAISKGKSEETASVKAAAYAKNLANFEQVGDLGKTMGAFYMFFRPAATGAVRAIESVAPAFRSLESVEAQLPPHVRDDPAALETFKKNYAERQAHARIMTMGLVGLGMVTYMMAQMLSDDDELGRNAVANDNMQQWTRFARFHIPKDITRAMGINEPVVFQIPWGFGLGAFAASGAQIAATVAGKSSVSDALANIFLQISLDSFVPIPVSKMSPIETPLEFFLDSIAPSVTRPILEFALNKNGLGQDIYNDQNRRFGDAYTGGDKVPEIYRDAARGMANVTTGDIDISPNTLYFLSNSYLDGISRIFEAGYGISNLAGGKKDFNPKTDLPLFGSFFGARSNVDSREFSAVEKQIQGMERKINMFASNPEVLADYMVKHPFDVALVDTYNQQVQGQLKDLRSQAKQIRLNKDFPQNEREAMLKVITFQQNLIKHNMVEQFKAFGVTP